MPRIKIGWLFMGWGIFMVFVTIYQHNAIIKLNYEKQRLVLMQNRLDKERSERMVELFSLRNFSRVTHVATERLGMRPLALSLVMTLTTTVRGA